jgi:chromosomal replication initiator protein
MKYDIFISHSSKDKDFAHKLAEYLKEHGVKIWLDVWNLTTSDSLAEVIKKRIDESRYIFIIMSADYFASVWTEQEWKMAMHYEMSVNAIKVIPILYKDCEIPSILKTKVYADFRNPDNYKQSINQLINHFFLLKDKEKITGRTIVSGDISIVGSTIETIDSEKFDEMAKYLKEAVDHIKSESFVEVLNCHVLWNKCLDIIRDIVPKDAFNTWFLPIVPQKWENNTITLQVPSMFFYEYLEEKYFNLLKVTLTRVMGKGTKWKYTVLMENTGKTTVNSQLNANYTFDSFIGNQLARSAGLAIAKDPGKTAVNPFFIYGGSGLGKTHLANAVGLMTKELHPEKNILYVTANKFQIQYTDAVKNNTAYDFLNFYQMIDVLIIDDIQDFAGKTGTQNTFLHIFNHLRQSGKQLVLTSDRSPNLLQGLDQRILSRFKWGLHTRLETPDFETRKTILQNKVKADGLVIPEIVINYIAEKVKDNVRELEGVLISLLAQSMLTKAEINTDLAQKVISKSVNVTEKVINVMSIQEVVCEYYSMDIRHIQTKSRKREVVQARQIAMYLARKYTKNSLSSIGEQIGNRDSATVSHACKIITDLLNIDKGMRQCVDTIEKALKFDSYKSKIIEKINIDTIEEIIEEINIDAIKEIIICLFEKDYTKAISIFNENECKNISNEAFFLQDVMNIKDSDGAYPNLRWQAKLWQLISRYCFQYNNNNNENAIKTSSIEKSESTNTTTPYKNSQEKGAALENSTLELFKELFEMNDTAEREILEKVRKQNSGYQFGFDIEVHYLTQNKKRIKCKIECKNYNERVTHKDISEKVDTLRYGDQSTYFDHFIIISPNSNPDNKLNKAIENWNADPNIPFFVQIWCPNTLVQNFFGLNPDIFNHFYQVNDKNNKEHPKDWSNEKRNEVISEFKNKLKPRINLPLEWKRYIETSEEKLLLKKEDRTEYLHLYTNFIDLKALDINGDTLDNSLYNYVCKWLSKENKCLFLLGEFGDGKTFFTYYLSQRLIEEYKQAPKEGWIPVRFSLQDFANEGVYDSQYFIKRRLDLIGADYNTFREVYFQNKVLVILDGFDEMSKHMDEDTLTENIKRLINCYEELENENIKVLITSRKHFFENKTDKERLIRRLGDPKLIQIAPISRKIVVSHLEEMTETEEQKEKLVRLQNLHDPIGLASKPLFLSMLKATINDLEIDDISEIKIYDEYIKKCLERKFSIQLDDKKLKSDRNNTINNIRQILEKLALKIHETDEEYISLDSFIEENYEQDDKGIAEHLWSLTEYEKDEDINATNLIAYRTLLIRHKDINKEGRYVDFCHRSMREYFVAKGVCSMLINDNERCKTFFKTCDLSREMVYFISQMIKTSDQQNAYIEVLNRFIKETSQCYEKANRKEYERLGCNSINIIYLTLNCLPSNDYSNLILDGAYLTGADLSNKNFTKTSLKNSILYNVNFENSIFKGADITGAHFDKTHKIVSIFYSDNDECLYVLYEDNSIWKWNLNNYKFDKVLKLDKGNPSHLIVLSSNCIAFIEQNRENVVYFYKDGKFEGEFKIDNNLKVINICENTLLLEQDIEEQNINGLKYIIHNIKDDSSYSISTNQKLICSSLGTYGILTCSKTDLKVNNGDFLRSITEITHISSYDCGNGNFIIGLTNKNGEILVTHLSKNDNTWNLGKLHSLKTFENITYLSFIDRSTIVVAEGDEKIYVLRMKEDFTLSLQSPALKIELLCKGMKIEGLKSDKEYQFLNELINKAF